MVVEVNLAPRTTASQTRSKSSARDSARTIASLVALSAAYISVQAVFLFLGFRSFVGTIEISEGECDILREPLQQVDAIRA